MKLKELENILGALDDFRNPRIDLEQYATQPHLAARTLYTIEQSFGDISDKIVADLGCGPGRLAIGASLLGAAFCCGFDVDAESAEVFVENCRTADAVKTDCILCDVSGLTLGKYDGPFKNFFDTVITNPPFGTKNNQGIDVQFLEAGLNLSKNSVYSFHKSACRPFLLRKAKAWQVSMEVVAELVFDLPSSYKKHKKDSVDIKVDFIRTAHLP
ncbi:rRNA N6-adenosine-methyltransferase METTL5-like [Paramacrobiotus metropolitanus]|uniref:rRNA N6-adenosine-methyltransferase METTL5-like n=1 Tax=Paramacrobiotus metropolitanus TaxID=2943436 RepID=UPI0024462021|nr:rRNA N6-adenosine-methyltransferase METTL5-like [Paramacrobiotus metropolitanus]XP_055338198.1 rRNA N6-adenosine-methyltransferase METTL5-like [Paramacrobiotus metropolitanus]XP_055338200.1 rRNA N6-adenosine-methyltransferase METTL5-like [Paramacrobiotus metropolitanus]XP_055338201.1 rRNA N6-adenosine-methyltransferase METTL5-like [Paramacrobiotus metropolitanus]